MPVIIDGHNLIPRIPGLSLRDIDDELRLVELLQDYCQRSWKQVEVFFDNAPPGQSGVRTFGSVKARFIREGKTADRAIQEKLEKLGRSARNWTVVSSDRQVQAAARAARARVLSADEFLREMRQLEKPEDKLEGEAGPGQLSPEEIDDWLKLFGKSEE